MRNALVVLAATLIVLTGLQTLDRGYDAAASARFTAFNMSADGERLARCLVRPAINGIIPAGFDRREPCSAAEISELKAKRAAALDVGFLDALNHAVR
jgi:hypothetical protein